MIAKLYERYRNYIHSFIYSYIVLYCHLPAPDMIDGEEDVVMFSVDNLISWIELMIKG
jgi:hypothetical protein